jgi:hypothetical protein
MSNCPVSDWMATKPNSFLGWLGRQIGHVKGAVKTEVPQVVYKKTTVHEAALQERPNETMRRTVVDEIIRGPSASSNASEDRSKPR